MNQNYVEESGAVDAFNAGHFNVGCGAGAGDVGGEGWGLLAAIEVFREGFNDLAGMEDAEVPVGEQGEDAAAFSWAMVEDDGSGFGDGAGGCGDNAFGLFDFGVGEAVVEGEFETVDLPGGGDQPFVGGAGGGKELELAAGGELSSDGVSEGFRGAFDDFGVVFTEAFDEEADAGFAGEAALANVGAGEGGAGFFTGRIELGGGLDAAEGLLAG